MPVILGSDTNTLHHVMVLISGLESLGTAQYETNLMSLLGTALLLFEVNHYVSLFPRMTFFRLTLMGCS